MTGTGTAPNDEVDVGAEADFPEGALRGARVRGEPIVLARLEGTLPAMAGLCTHMSVLLEEGELEGGIVRCPRHFAGFDLVTGHAVDPPACGTLPTYPVRVENGRVLVGRLPSPGPTRR